MPPQPRQQPTSSSSSDWEYEFDSDTTTSYYLTISLPPSALHTTSQHLSSTTTTAPATDPIATASLYADPHAPLAVSLGTPGLANPRPGVYSLAKKRTLAGAHGARAGGPKKRGKRRVRNPETGELEWPEGMAEPDGDEEAEEQADQVEKEGAKGEVPKEVEVVDLDGDYPLVLFGGVLYRCEWADALGTDMIFVEREEADVDADGDGNADKNREEDGEDKDGKRAADSGKDEATAQQSDGANPPFEPIRSFKTHDLLPLSAAQLVASRATLLYPITTDEEEVQQISEAISSQRQGPESQPGSAATGDGDTVAGAEQHDLSDDEDGGGEDYEPGMEDITAVGAGRKSFLHRLVELQVRKGEIQAPGKEGEENGKS